MTKRDEMPWHYDRVHKWIRKCMGDADRCMIDETHVSKRFEWANISREYHMKLTDWIMMCPSCHRQFDKFNCGLKAFRRYKEKMKHYDELEKKWRIEYVTKNPIEYWI